MAANEIRWTAQSADAYILTSSGNPLGRPLDVPAYLKYLFGGKGLQEILTRGTQNDFERVHILFCAKVRDGSLRGVDGDMMSLFTFAALKITERLRETTGQNWITWESEPVKENAA